MCDAVTKLSRVKKIEEECLHGSSIYDPELATLYNVFKPTIETTDDEYIENFIESLKRRPCSSFFQRIVEQTTFHFLVRKDPPPSIAPVTEDDVIKAVDRLHKIFVEKDTPNENMIETWKTLINQTKVTNEIGEKVSVLDFKSFKDGKTALENAVCNKVNDGDKFSKLIRIINILQPPNEDTLTDEEPLHDQDTFNGPNKIADYNRMTALLESHGFTEEQKDNLRNNAESIDRENEFPSTNKFTPPNKEPTKSTMFLNLYNSTANLFNRQKGGRKTNKKRRNRKTNKKRRNYKRKSIR